MATLYTGNPTATQTPGAAPAEGVAPIFNLPEDGIEDLGVSALYQPLKEAADYIAFLMAGVVHDRIFGRGTDGVFANSAASILTPKEYSSMTLSSSYTVVPRAPIQVRDTLTVGSGCLFLANGSPGSTAPPNGSDGGTTSAEYWMRGGTSGGYWPTGASATVVPATTMQFTDKTVVSGGNGGAGGYFGDSQANSGCSAGATDYTWTGAAQAILTAPAGFFAGPLNAGGVSYLPGIYPIAGGMGGGAGGLAGGGSTGDTRINKPGAGGAGGGVIWIAARNLVLQASQLCFSARGGAGGAQTGSGSGNGGGGGGGTIVIICKTCIDSGGSAISITNLAGTYYCSVSPGGSGGAGGDSPALGGYAGQIIAIQLPQFGA